MPANLTKVVKRSKTVLAKCSVRSEALEDSPFHGLNYLIQYRRKDECVWHNMAAFDAELAAERYFKKQGGDDSPWEYRMVEATEDSRP